MTAEVQRIKFGSSARTRTSNLVVNSHPLCRLSYRGMISGVVEAAPRFELGIKDLQSSALPLGYAAVQQMERKTGFEPATPTLARLCSTPELLPHPFSIVRRWWRDPESNWGHADFQSAALPSELSRLNWTVNGGADETRTRDLRRDRPTL